MRLFPRLALVPLAMLAFAACHAAARASDPPRSVSPTMDLEVEDRGADKSVHTARFSLGLVNGNADVKSNDGEMRYALETHRTNADGSSYAVSLKRADGKGAVGDLDLFSAVPLPPNTRVLVARIERADGRVTAVTAQLR